MTFALHTATATHPGHVHPKNEDSFAVQQLADGGLLLLVCDGMGGMGRGDEASQLAVAVLTRVFAETTEGSPRDRMARALAAADDAIRVELCATGIGWAGSTAALAYVIDGRVHVGWVGDSRVCLVRNGEVVSRTRDHKLVQDLVESGQLTADEAKHSSLSSVITRALGGRPAQSQPVVPAFLDEPWVLADGDRVLVCSDGLVDLVADPELPSLLAGPVKEACAALVAIALDRGGHDNITVIVGAWMEQLPEELLKTVPAAAPRQERPQVPVAAPRLEAWMVVVILIAAGLGTWLLVHSARSVGG